jgi:hypothetical protein
VRCRQCLLLLQDTGADSSSSSSSPQAVRNLQAPLQLRQQHLQQQQRQQWQQ